MLITGYSNSALLCLHSVCQIDYYHLFSKKNNFFGAGYLQLRKSDSVKGGQCMFLGLAHRLPLYLPSATLIQEWLASLSRTRIGLHSEVINLGLTA